MLYTEKRAGPAASSFSRPVITIVVATIPQGGFFCFARLRRMRTACPSRGNDSPARDGLCACARPVPCTGSRRRGRLKRNSPAARACLKKAPAVQEAAMRNLGPDRNTVWKKTPRKRSR